MRAFVVLGLVFPYQAKRLVWGRSPKRPVLCRVERKALTQSINPVGSAPIWLANTCEEGKKLANFQLWVWFMGQCVSSCKISWRSVALLLRYGDFLFLSNWRAFAILDSLCVFWYHLWSVFGCQSTRHMDYMGRARGGVDHVTRHVWPLTKVKRSRVT